MKKDLLNDYFRFFGIILSLFDLALLLSACYLSFWFYFHSFHLPDSYTRLLLIVLFFSIPLFPYFGLYSVWRGGSILEELKSYFLAVVVLFLSTALLLFLLKIGSIYSRIWFVLWLALTLMLGFGFRVLLRLFVRWLRAKGFNQKNIVLIGGDNRLGQRVLNTLLSADWLGFNIKGVFYPSLEYKPLKNIADLGQITNLLPYLQQKSVDEVWITLPLQQTDEVKAILEVLQDTTVNVRLVPDIFSLSLINHSMTEVAGLPVISLSSSPMTTGNRLLKAIEDKVLATIILLLIWPVMLGIAIGIKLSSKGPIFFRQIRLGYNGEPFEILKFRSMPVNVEQKTGAVWAKGGENRATAFGAFLRRTSLDELPQFINVLKGDMSIVGPRPERPVFVDKFKHEIPLYMKKHMVKAGITGWAQVNGWRGDTSLEKRIECDLYYIENWSLWFDIKIVFLTIFKGFVHKNAY